MNPNTEAIAKIRERTKALLENQAEDGHVEPHSPAWAKRREEAIELRYLNLALAFLRGIPYASVEPRCDPWKWQHEVGQVVCEDCAERKVNHMLPVTKGQLELREVLILAGSAAEVIDDVCDQWTPWVAAAQAHIDSQKAAHSAAQKAKAEQRRVWSMVAMVDNLKAGKKPSADLVRHSGTWVRHEDGHWGPA